MLFSEKLTLELHCNVELIFVFLGDWFVCCRSFAETCTRLQSALQSFLQGISGPAVSGNDDDLVRLSFNAIEVVYSVRSLEIIVCCSFF